MPTSVPTRQIDYSVVANNDGDAEGSAPPDCRANAKRRNDGSEIVPKPGSDIARQHVYTAKSAPKKTHYKQIQHGSRQAVVAFANIIHIAGLVRRGARADHSGRIKAC